MQHAVDFTKLVDCLSRHPAVCTDPEKFMADFGNGAGWRMQFSSIADHPLSDELVEDLLHAFSVFQDKVRVRISLRLLSVRRAAGSEKVVSNTWVIESPISAVTPSAVADWIEFLLRLPKRQVISPSGPR